MSLSFFVKFRTLPVPVLAVGVLCCGVPPGQAEEYADNQTAATGRELKRATAGQPAPAEEGQHEELPALESSRRGVRQATEWVARGVDSWFGDKPFTEGGKVSRGRVRSRIVWREHDEVDVNLRFRASVRLPNLQDKAYVLIGSENEKDIVRDRPDTIVEQQRLLKENKPDDDTFFAGIGLRLLDDISMSIGLRDLHKPYLKLRYRHEWYVGEHNRIFFQETGFWAMSDGFGATTSLDFEHALSPVLSVRWLNSGTVSEEDEGLDWYSSIGLYRTFGEQRQLSGEVLADGETGKAVDVEEYGVLVKWRQPVYKDWLLGELSAGHYWERKSLAANREGQWALGVGLQMNF